MYGAATTCNATDSKDVRCRDNLQRIRTGSQEVDPHGLAAHPEMTRNPRIAALSGCRGAHYGAGRTGKLCDVYRPPWGCGFVISSQMPTSKRPEESAAPRNIPSEL